MNVCSVTVFVLAVAILTGVIYTSYFIPPLEKPAIKDGWWGMGIQDTTEVPSTEIHPLTIDIGKGVLDDLKRRLENSRYVGSLEDVNFHYGFLPVFMKTVVRYWLNYYDWKTQEETINKYNHFKTRIEGIDVHFVHVKPKLKKGQTAKPILMVHGWPGSFYEFYKIIPMLTEPTKYNGTDEDIFEVICPSIPGYGFSEEPHKKGFDQVAAARVFHKLMTRLGFDSYYVQGGDWGSIIVTYMSIMYESAVKGLHTNMATRPLSAVSTLKLLVGTVFPSAVVKESDRWKLYPVIDKIKMLIAKTGYLHIQATTPDTIGQALNDSPIGLGAYILEKFACWTNYEKHIVRQDGGLTVKIKIEDLLNNVMIYWVTGTITSSMRFYKEYFQSEEAPIYDSLPVNVPTGIASFPFELSHVPENFAALRFTNIVQYTDFDDGGHFAAFEVPELLVTDIRSFVRKVEELADVVP